MTTRKSNSSKSITSYSENSSNNGVSVHFNYHGHARVTYPGASYDPTGTDVEARASVAGVEDSNEELRQAEFDLAFDAKPKADKIFGEEVDKVIKALESAEKNWMTPNKCAQVTFTPETKSLKPLKKDKQDTFDAEVKSADGGKPDSGTWTVLKQANGTFTPTTAHSNPAKFNYTVKKSATKSSSKPNSKSFPRRASPKKTGSSRPNPT